MANAGILPIIGEKGQETSAFADAVDVMLTGAYYTIEAALPADGDGGAIVITSSIAGLTGMQRGYANALAQKNIRVNSVHPSGTATPMIANKQMGRLMVDVPEYQSVFENLLPVPFIEATDIIEATMYSCGRSGRYIIGITLPVGAGYTVK